MAEYLYRLHTLINNVCQCKKTYHTGGQKHSNILTLSKVHLEWEMQISSSKNQPISHILFIFITILFFTV